MTEAKPAPSSDPFAKALVDHHSLVNRESAFPDVYFHVDEGKSVLTCHYYVLKMRLPQLLEEGPASSGKKQAKPGKKAKGAKDTKVIIKINKSEMITARALERVLVYAYSGVIDERDYTPFKAIEVMRCCSLYNISRLMQMNEKYLQENLTMKNIFSLLKAADDHNVQEAKEICINFALANADFFTSANAEELGFKLYQEVTALLLKHHQDKDSKVIVPRQVTAEDTIVKDFKNLLGSAETTGDISFLIHGTEVKAHRAIVANQSDILAQLLVDQLDEPNKEGVKKHVNLDDKYARVTPDAFNAMLRFFYYGDTAIDIVHATQLMTFAKDFKLNNLYSLLEKIVANQDVTVNSVLSVLGVAYHPLMDENPSLQKALKEQCLNFVVENFTSIDFEPLMSVPSIVGVHILLATQRKIGSQFANLNLSEKIGLGDLKRPGGAVSSQSAAPPSSGWQKTVPGTPTGNASSPRTNSSATLQPSPSKRDARAGKKDVDKKSDEVVSPRSESKSSLTKTKTKTHKDDDKKKDKDKDAKKEK